MQKFPRAITAYFCITYFKDVPFSFWAAARLAQSAERKALNLVVVGSSPTVGVWWFDE